LSSRIKIGIFIGRTLQLAVARPQIHNLGRFSPHFFSRHWPASSNDFGRNVKQVVLSPEIPQKLEAASGIGM